VRVLRVRVLRGAPSEGAPSESAPSEGASQKSVRRRADGHLTSGVEQALTPPGGAANARRKRGYISSAVRRAVFVRFAGWAALRTSGISRARSCRPLGTFGRGDGRQSSFAMSGTQSVACAALFRAPAPGSKARGATHGVVRAPQLGKRWQKGRVTRGRGAARATPGAWQAWRAGAARATPGAWQAWRAGAV